jgi:hypothetical protein
MALRRTMLFGTGLVIAGAGAGYLAWPRDDPAYRDAVEANRRPLRAAEATGLNFSELVRFATLAANSHNTQPWLFQAQGGTIRISPDAARRCPVVDPEDRHVVASLGAATENLVLASAASGYAANVAFQRQERSADIAFERTAPRSDPAFAAIPKRQSTRAPFEPKPLAADELRGLEAAIATPGVRVRFLTARRDLDRLKEFVVQGNTQQCRDRAFVDELRRWVRFNQSHAARTGDGLFAGSSGNPSVPAWLGRTIFPYIFTAGAENPKYLAQIDGAAGALVLYAETDDASGWFQVGRASQRFQLEATARGILSSFVNQPVEVTGIRAEFAAWLGDGLRPALVIRFGRGDPLPYSLRRPVNAVLRAA